MTSIFMTKLINSPLKQLSCLFLKNATKMYPFASFEITAVIIYYSGTENIKLSNNIVVFY